MRHRKQVFVAAAAAAAAISAGAILVTSGSAETPRAAAVDTPLPEATVRAIARGGDAVDGIRIDVDTARGYRLAGSDETIWIATGPDGSACLFEADATTCSPAQGLTQHGLTAMRRPPNSQAYVREALKVQESELVGAAAAKALRSATEHLPLVEGPASFYGWVPKELAISSARLLDGDGKQIAESELNEGVYDLYVEDVSTARPESIQLERSDGKDPIVMGPIPWEVR